VSEKKTPFGQAADVIDVIASVGGKVGESLGGVAGTITQVVAIGAGIVSTFLRLSDPVVKITRAAAALREKATAEADMEALMKEWGA